MNSIQFGAGRLLVLDNKNDITIFSLDTRRQIANYAPPGHVTVMVSDPSLDYCLTGLQNGGSGPPLRGNTSSQLITSPR